MKQRIDQLLAGFGDGDAISHEALALQTVFQKMGYQSEIYADLPYVSTTLQQKCHGYHSYNGSPNDVLIYHVAIASPVSQTFRSSPAKKVIIYHNITPADYYRPYDEEITARLQKARQELLELKNIPMSVWADSRFNADELQALGFKDVQKLSLLFNPKVLDQPLSERIARKFRPHLSTILFVGRIAPNKKLDNLLAMYYMYRQLDPFSRLIIVGSSRSCPRYFSMLQLYAADLDLVNVCFEEFAAPDELPTYYRCADLFLTASEHEGFCLPLLEASYLGCPVIANHAGAMPETLGNSGVIYRDCDARALAGLAYEVIHNKELRQNILASQAAKLRELQERRFDLELQKLLKGVLDK